MDRAFHELSGAVLGLGFAEVVSPGLSWHTFGFVGLSVFVVMLPDRLEIGLLRHRGLTHSIVFLILMIFPLVIIVWWLSLDWSYLMLFGLAYFLHLISDAITRSGVALLYPFTSRRFRFFGGPIRTGGFRNHVLTVLCLLLVLAYLSLLLVRDVPFDMLLG